MSKVIRIPDKLFKRLEAHAEGFSTPASIIEMVLDKYEGVEKKNKTAEKAQHLYANQPEINYLAGSKETFKARLLKHKKAFLKFHFSNGEHEIKEWNASKFGENSSVDGNLRSGPLRGWKEKGIVKVEISIDQKLFS